MLSKVNPAWRIFLWNVILIFMLSGCGARTAKTLPPSFPEQQVSKSAVSKPSYALELLPAGDVPSLSDDLDGDSLELAIERSLQYFNRFKDTDVYYFGVLKSSVRKMKESLIAFRDIVKLPVPVQAKEEKIKDAFDFYRSAGDDGKGRVIFTGYYEPVLEGSFSKSEKYRYPLYRPPGEAIPRYRRAEIDGGGSLAGRNLEIIWVDDFVDLFFLHIQGSGSIRLPDGRLVQVGYAQSNGYPYRSISAYLLDEGKLTKGDLSMKSIKKFLREHPAEAASILNYNERYVFFRFVENGPLGALDVPVTGGRTIASDHNVYPKGALALIRARKPVIDIDKE
ncbi:MAG: MltA domain-containing protein, partial [Syntrophales bacterium]|nr:MltA domain-containing protein [Syntrophales bacterium]